MQHQKPPNIGSESVMVKSIFGFLTILLTSLGSLSAQETDIPATYQFTVQQGWLTMKDGVKLAVDYYMPTAKKEGEKFPLVLEVLPYRKDDSFAARDYPVYSYWAERGIAGARVDIRGTGASEGRLGDREYSDQELADILDIINQLSKAPQFNGNIGMMGKSWSAINGMATAMARPKNLKALIFMHSATDLYAMDVHGWDGAVHIDVFSVESDIENMMPQTPKYPLDNAFFKNRFDVKPWIFTYLHHQRDSQWWMKGRPLISDYKALNIPVYAIGGYLDGYRDAVPQMLENTDVPIRAEMNTHNHAFPFNGVPGPTYEWRQLSTRWWLYWLNGQDTGIMNEPQNSVFMRDYTPANSEITMTPGKWWSVDRVPKTDPWMLLFGKNNALTPKPQAPSVVKFKQNPGMADETLNWWGERTGDMKQLDSRSLVFDSVPMRETKLILGCPKVFLNTSVDKPLLDWIIRLEDVAPDGSVSFITGGLLQSSQYKSRMQPQDFPLNTFTDIEIPLHFTTWTFRPGHKVRIALSMIEFPLVWPTPYITTVQLSVGDPKGSRVSLPTVLEKDAKIIEMPKVGEIAQRPGVTWITDKELTPFTVTNHPQHKIDVAEAEESSIWEVDGRTYKRDNRLTYIISTEDPANTTFKGDGNYSVTVDGREIRAKSLTTIVSDEKNFTVKVQRKLYENSTLVREKEWQEVIPRDFQ